MTEWRTEWLNGRQNGRTAGMADGMVKRWEWSNGGNGGRNGRMADRNGYIRTIYGTHRRRQQHLLIFHSIEDSVRNPQTLILPLES